MEPEKASTQHISTVPEYHGVKQTIRLIGGEVYVRNDKDEWIPFQSDLR